jgi:hypothetical protein
MTLAAELNPHETELNPHEAVPGRLAVPERIKKWRLSAHGAELTSTQPTGAGPAVTPPAIRGTRDAPPPPLAELAHAYPPFGTSRWPASVITDETPNGTFCAR